MQIHAEIVVNGMVQGVGFRYFTQHKANEYRLNGYVKNQGDGSVLCEVEGEEGLVQDFIKDLKIGPAFSRVSSTSVNISPTVFGYRSFEVRY